MAIHNCKKWKVDALTVLLAKTYHRQSAFELGEAHLGEALSKIRRGVELSLAPFEGEPFFHSGMSLMLSATLLIRSHSV